MLKVERLGEVGHVLAAPWSHGVKRDVLSLSELPLFDELYLRRVIGMLGVDVSSTRPRADDVERETEPWAGVDIAEFAIRILNPLYRGARRTVVGGDVIAWMSKVNSRNVSTLAAYNDLPQPPVSS